MARTQSLGALIGLTIFVLLFLCTLGTSILFYVNWQEAEEKANEQERMRILVVGSDITADPELQAKYKVAEAGGDTVARQFQTQRRRLLTVLGISNTENFIDAIEQNAEGPGDLDIVRQQFFNSYKEFTLPVASILKNAIPDRPNVEIDFNTPFPSVVDLLASALQAKEKEVEAQAAQLSTMQATITQLNASIKQKDETNARVIADYEDSLEKLGRDRTDSVAYFDSEMEGHKNRVEEKNEDNAEQVNLLDNQISNLTNELRRKDTEISQLVNWIKTIERNIPTTVYEPDGQILASNTQARTVNINLGQGDKIMPGLTFEVFQKDSGVIVDETSGRLVRGIATVEVIRVFDTHAQCRVVRQRYNSTIQPGDLIANLAYDRSKQYRFVVYGQFDLNNDGRPSELDTARMKDLIDRNGGVIINDPAYDSVTGKFEIDILTDYIIMGVPPQRPTARMWEDADGDPQAMDRLQELQERADRYDTLVDSAKILSIPILNQNRTLALIGAYQN